MQSMLKAFCALVVSTSAGKTFNEVLEYKPFVTDQISPHHYVTHKMMHRYGADAEWTERGDLVLGVDPRGNILDAQINSAKIENAEEL